MVARVRRPIAPSTILLAAALLTINLANTGCSEQGSAEQANAPVGIVMRQSVVTVENRSAGDLDGVTLTVVAFGNKEYSKPLGTLARAESRNTQLGELSSADGSTFSVTFTRPKAVKLSARDTSGNPVDVEVPWK